MGENREKYMLEMGENGVFDHDENLTFVYILMYFCLLYI